MLPVTNLDKIQRMLNSFWWGLKSGSSGGIKWLRWEKLAMNKEDEGLNFLNLNGFNLALLRRLLEN